MKSTTIYVVSGLDRIHVTRDNNPEITITHWDGDKTREEAIAEATEYAHELVSYYESQGYKVKYKQLNPTP